MNIALYHNLPSGGANRHTFEQIWRLAQRGHTIDEYTLSTADRSFLPYANVVQESYVYPVDLRQWFEGRIPFLTPYIHAWQGYNQQVYLNRIACTVAQEINRRSYDLVFVKDCQLTTIPFVMQHIRHPQVFYMHSLPHSRQLRLDSQAGKRVVDRIKQILFAPSRRSHALRMRYIDRRNLYAANRILINSHFSACWLQSHYGVSSQVVYPGVDVQKFRPSGEQRGEFVLSVGSLTSGKGYRFIVAALGRIPDEKRPKFIIAANFIDSGELYEIERLARLSSVQLEIQTVKDDKVMVQFYNRAMMLLFAPHDEPLGLAALESMACGTPVVGVREGGLTETIIDGQTGILVGRDTQEFADAVIRLLEHPDERNRMGVEGINHVRAKWTWTRAVDELERAFEDVIRGTN